MNGLTRKAASIVFTPVSAAMPGAATSGAVAVEFALAAPLLIALFLGTVGYGVAIHTAMEARAVAGAGITYGVMNGYTGTAIDQSELSAAALSAASTPSLFTVASALEYGCPTTAGIAASDQGATCPDGAPARAYVRVTVATPNYVPLFSDFSPALLPNVTVYGRAN